MSSSIRGRIPHKSFHLFTHNRTASSGIYNSRHWALEVRDFDLKFGLYPSSRVYTQSLKDTCLSGLVTGVIYLFKGLTVQTIQTEKCLTYNECNDELLYHMWCWLKWQRLDFLAEWTFILANISFNTESLIWYIKGFRPFTAVCLDVLHTIYYFCDIILLIVSYAPLPVSKWSKMFPI